MNWWTRYQSVVFNVLTLTLAILSLSEVLTLIPKEYNGILAAVNAIGNLILREVFKYNNATKNRMDKLG